MKKSWNSTIPPNERNDHNKNGPRKRREGGHTRNDRTQAFETLYATSTEPEDGLAF